MGIGKFVVVESQLIEEAIELIEINRSRCVIIINKQNKVVGILSEGDILRSILKGISLLSPIKNVMVTNFKYVFDKYDSKVKEYFKQGITLIPVLSSSNELIDVVTFTDYANTQWK
jgi:CBS domain-containing protein